MSTTDKNIEKNTGILCFLKILFFSIPEPEKYPEPESFAEVGASHKVVSLKKLRFYLNILEHA